MCIGIIALYIIQNVENDADIMTESYFSCVIYKQNIKMYSY